MLIDCHQHVNWGDKNSDAVVADMDRAGIDITWLLTWEVPEEEYDPGYLPRLDPRYTNGLPLAGVVEACERHPGRFVPGYANDPRRPDAIERLEAAAKIHGVRVFGELKLRILMDDPDVLRTFRKCGELKLPVLFHIDVPARVRPELPARDYWYCLDIDRLETALKDCPDTIFIGHAPGFWQHISGDGYDVEEAYPDGEVTPGGRVPELLAKYPNLYADLSANSALNAISRPPEGRGREFLIEFQDKLLFGRDCFRDDLIEYLKKQELPAEAWEKITSGNALRLVPPEQ
ncbi:MAG: amidohydrolase family protein [Planctomycetota bacterium]|jgi:predicted TIM-barrel fold metal-dependent hydrolase